jgi:hypothetical protein
MSPNRALKSSNWRTRTEVEQDSCERQRDVVYGERGQRTASCEPESGTRIYVGNMPYTAQRRDVEQLFEDKGFQLQVSLSLEFSLETCPNSNAAPILTSRSIDSHLATLRIALSIC